MKKTLMFAIAAVAVSGAVCGAPVKRASSADIFGIAVDTPLPEYVKPADTNGVVTVKCPNGRYCVGRAFCGISPKIIEMGNPDENDRAMVRRVVSSYYDITPTRAEWLLKRVTEKLDGYTNLKRYAEASKANVNCAEWYGVGADGVPFAVTIWIRKLSESCAILQCEVMDFAAYATGEGRRELPSLKEKDRPGRLALIDKSSIAKSEKMMREKAYSGMWACKAKCFDRIAFCFDKSGIGCFDMVIDGFMTQQVLSGGWFHWTADDKGQITLHASPTRAKAFTMNLKYDCKRNRMVPDVNAPPFSTKVIPDNDNPKCEMKYISDFPVMEALKRRSENKDAGRSRLEREMREKMLARMPRRDVASFDELIALVKGLGDEAGVSLAGEGRPTVMVGGWPEPRVLVDVEIARGGDPKAPKFEGVAGKEGPDIAGKKELEQYFDPAELKDLAKSHGAHAHEEEKEDVGIWTWETRTTVSVVFDKDKTDKFEALLKTILDKWYKFPVKAAILKPDPELIKEMEAMVKEFESR